MHVCECATALHVITIFAWWFGTDLFMVVERSRDITHVKLLQSLVAKISNVYKCKREQVIVYMQHQGHVSLAKKFTVDDAKDGFWQKHLDTESHYKTTFNTPFGRC